jgi:DNA polymerase
MPIVKNPKLELWLAAHTLRLFTRPTAHFDFDLASRIRADMQEEIDRAIADIAPWIMEQLGFTEEDIAEATELGVVGEIVQEELSKNLRFCKYLLDLGVDIPTKPGKPSKNMIPMTGEGMIPALAKDDEGTKLLIGHEDDTVRQLMQGRLAVKSWPNWIGRIDKLEAQARASRGLVRVPLKYYGAHTGRFSGEEKVNLGNLGGSGRGKEISKLIGEIRHTICAPPGCLFILVDSAQIEARKLAWLAGQLDLLDEFRNDGDPYSTLASQLFGCRVWKWRDDDVEEYPGQKKKITIYRGFGKDAILGCGYGMGASTFYDRCYANDELRPHFDSGEFDVRFIQNLIDTYRTTYPKIPEYWRRVERAWWLATKYKEPQDVDGRVHFWHKDGTTFMRLPSGRIMRYFDAKVNAKNELRSSTCKTQNNPAGKLWGGTITENIDQAASRDALVFWIQEVEKAGVHVVHHVYDEIIAVAPECDAESVMNTMMDIMETKPDWAEGVPYKAKGEGKISPYYVK